MTCSSPARLLAAGAAALTLLLAPGPAQGAVAEISTRDNFFAPVELELSFGDTLRWTFGQMEAVHTVTVTRPGGGSPLLDRTVEPGDPPLDFTPPAAGRYLFLCQIHSQMAGRADVLAASEPRAPETVATLDPAQPGSGGVYGGPVTLALEASDDSGIERTEYRINGAAPRSYQGPIQFATEGVRTIDYRSTDIAGVQEAWHAVGLEIDDTTPPVTTHELEPPFPDGGGAGDAVTVKLHASDPGGLGVAATEFRIDGGAFRAYDGALVVPGGGKHLLEYRSHDRGGNREETRALEFRAPGPSRLVRLAFEKPIRRLRARSLIRGVTVRVSCEYTEAGSVALGVGAKARRRLGLRRGQPLAAARLSACKDGVAEARLEAAQAAVRSLTKLGDPIAATLRAEAADITGSRVADQVTVRIRPSLSTP